MIPDSFKQDLLNRVDIVELVGRSVQLKKAGANYLGLCPFHNEKTPSFTVSPAKQFYHCFGCGKHGNAIGFLMDYGGMGYIDALKDLASSVGMQLPEEQPRSPEEAQRKERETDLFGVMETAMKFYRAKLKDTPRAIEYLKGRGLEGRIAARFGIGYAPDDWQGLKGSFENYSDSSLVECGLVIENEGKRYDRFRDRVMFPIFNARGSVIGFGGRVLDKGEPKYLNSPETQLFQKGSELYGLSHARDAIRAAGRVLVVEGYMDVVGLAQHGVEYAVATLGTATTPVHVAKLLRLTDEIVYCFDGDAAGRKAAWRALEVTAPVAPDNKPIKFLFLPEGEDPDTYIQKHGKEKFESLLARADTLSQFLLSELRSQFNLDTAEGRAQFVSAAKPYAQKVTAPILRIQLINSIAELGRISEDDIRRLMQLPESQRTRKPAPARKSAVASNSPEWSLLYSLLLDLSMIVHVDPALLRSAQPETRALLAVRDVFDNSDEPPSAQMLIETLQGNPVLELLLQASRYADELGLNAEDARAEMQGALGRLDEMRRKAELDNLLGTGLRSKEELTTYNDKLLIYNRLRGAIPSPTRSSSASP